MNWPLVFALANGLALIGWIVLIFAPRRQRLVSALRVGVVGGLCLLYTGILGVGLTGGFGEGGGDIDYTTIAGVRSIILTDGGVTLAWTHYLAFDLFVGTWTALDADKRRISRFVQAPILLLTFIAGPVGMLLHLIFSRAIGRARTDG